jgi:hypothetical protein
MRYRKKYVTIQYTIPAEWNTDDFISEATEAIADAIGERADLVDFRVMYATKDKQVAI